MAGRQVPGKKRWVVFVNEDTQYRASLIATLYKLKMGDVVERAMICYANALRIQDKMEKEFPREGIDTPPRSGKPTRPPRLSGFKMHRDFWDANKPEEPAS